MSDMSIPPVAGPSAMGGPQGPGNNQAMGDLFAIQGAFTVQQDPSVAFASVKDKIQNVIDLYDNGQLSGLGNLGDDIDSLKASLELLSSEKPVQWTSAAPLLVQVGALMRDIFHS